MHVTLPDVFVINLNGNHMDVITEIRGQTISTDELFMAALNYWRWGIYVFDHDEDDVWEQVHEAVMGLPAEAILYLQYKKWKSPLPDCTNSESDDLTVRVITVAEQLGPALLAAIGTDVERIDHICRAYVIDQSLYVHFYPQATCPPTVVHTHWNINDGQFISPIPGSIRPCPADLSPMASVYGVHRFGNLGCDVDR